jgi:hypothetical protein
MEKRVYMPGYYVDRHNLKHNQNKEVLVKDENGKKTIQNNNFIVEQKEETINNITPIQPKTNNYILASVDNSIIPFTLPTFIFSKNIKPVKQQKLINKDLTLNNTVEPEECDTLILCNC